MTDYQKQLEQAEAQAKRAQARVRAVKKKLAEAEARERQKAMEAFFETGPKQIEELESELAKYKRIVELFDSWCDEYKIGFTDANGAFNDGKYSFKQYVKTHA